MLKVSLAQMTAVSPLQRRVQIQYLGKDLEAVAIMHKILYKGRKGFIIREAAFGVRSFVHRC